MADRKTSELGRRVLGKLEAQGYDVASLDGRTIAQLERIEAAIASESDAHRAAKAEMRAHMLTVDSISKVAGISRPTIYNKKVLKDYVSIRREEEKIFYEGERVEALRKQLKEGEEKINKMLRRDGELVIAYAEIERLKERVKRLEEYLNDIPVDIREELDAMGKIIPFSRLG